MSGSEKQTESRETTGHPWRRALVAGVLGAALAVAFSYFVIGPRRDRSSPEAPTREQPVHKKGLERIESAAASGEASRGLRVSPGQSARSPGAARPLETTRPRKEPASAPPGVSEESVSAEDSPVNQPEQPTIAIRESSTPGELIFLVQVSSNRRREYAEAAVEELKRDGYAAEIWEVEIPEKGRWHRVVAGSFDTKAEAEELARDLRRATRWRDARVIERRR